ncbi:hypothetical protein GF339_18090 [candidate division KSB3 bacterium]|uniref:Uncharacterized protein n=1 Tax=candidate division KSB3 bacterium TaxID=2044937 RepID=A0A9D5JYH2_9BACT|nr:hypothetical protein [candidate division KSB3 bacterium]MBD3326500.1 hypothetical protein [candidate division KSB3 bacterium]
MHALLTILKEKQVDKAFDVIGIDFDACFTQKLGENDPNPYQDHEWVVKVVPVFGHVVNAVPRAEKLQELFWEEWFTKDGIIYHHILYLQQPEHYDEIFEAPDHDDIHPERTLGKTWYVIDDQDVSPVLLR